MRILLCFCFIQLRTEQIFAVIVKTVLLLIVLPPPPTVLHDNKLTHTDLKPENILFVNSDFTMSYNVEKVRGIQLPQMAGNL